MWHARKWRRIRREWICGVMFSRNSLRNHLHMKGFVMTSHFGVRKNLVRRPIYTYHMIAILHHTCSFLPWLG